jgi:hypothetical protein
MKLNDYCLGNRSSIPGRSWNHSPHHDVYRWVLGPTHPLIQWISEAILSEGVEWLKGLNVMLTIFLVHLVLSSIMRGHLPPRSLHATMASSYSVRGINKPANSDRIRKHICSYMALSCSMFQERGIGLIFYVIHVVSVIFPHSRIPYPQSSSQQ